MKTRLFRFVVIVSVLALASLACGLAVPGSDPTAAPTKTLPVLPTAAGNGNGGNGLGDAGNNNGGINNNGANNNGGNPPSDRPLFQDDFRGRDSNWGVGTDADSAVEYVNDALQFILYTTNYFVYSTPGETEYQNIHIEVTVANSSADKNAAFGIMCRQQFMDDEFYYAYITPNGDYGIVMSQFIEDDVDLATGSSDLIPQNAASYRLGFDCGNGVLTLYVNGQQIDTAADATYTGGTVALFAWSDEVPSGVTVSFDDFIITALP